MGIALKHPFRPRWNRRLHPDVILILLNPSWIHFQQSGNVGNVDCKIRSYQIHLFALLNPINRTPYNSMFHSTWEQSLPCASKTSAAPSRVKDFPAHGHCLIIKIGRCVDDVMMRIDVLMTEYGYQWILGYHLFRQTHTMLCILHIWFCVHDYIYAPYTQTQEIFWAFISLTIYHNMLLVSLC